MRLPMLFEDDSLVVVDKPGGVPVHGSGAGETTVETLLRAQLGGRAVSHGFTVSAVHRLDRDTSGVLVFARRRRACSRVMEQFAHGRVAKSYLALVLGGPKEEKGSIALPLAGLGRREGREQEALTLFRVVARASEATLVECRPKTGRTHQLRRHLAAIGCPIAGDERYGSPRFDEHARAKWGLPRLFLHAARLTLHHPDDDRPLVFESPLPDELAQVLARAGVAWPKG